MRLITATLALGLFSALPGNASPISAERPGFASGPVPLARGLTQIEAGYQYSADGNIDVHNLPQLLFRRGLTDNLELQAAWSGYTEVDFPGGSIDGLSDLTLGVKTQLREQHELFDVGIYGALSLPIGDREFSSDAIDPTVGVFWTYSRTNRPTIFGTVIASSASIADDRELTGGASIGMGFNIDSSWGAYVELFSLLGAGEPAHNANGGFTYLVNDDLQLDIEAGIGLSDDAGDYFFGFGVARRW